MKKKNTNRRNRPSPKSAVHRGSERKKMFSKRRGGVIGASMIMENRNVRTGNLGENKKDAT
jgi:hypothetical protein